MERIKNFFLDAPFECILLIYGAFCFLFTSVAWALDKRMPQNPQNDPRYYHLCAWYQKPKTLRDHFFKKLVNWKLFWNLREEFEVVAFGTALIFIPSVILLLLFV